MQVERYLELVFPGATALPVGLPPWSFSTIAILNALATFVLSMIVAA
jgi:hypothetical protein